MREPAILVVDDEPAIRELLRIAVERRGVRVATACGGADAINQLGDSRFCAIILDLVMPRGSGHDVLRFLGERGQPTPPVIVLSASGDRTTSSLDPALVTAILQKPFDLEFIVDVICSFVMTLSLVAPGQALAPSQTVRD